MDAIQLLQDVFGYEDFRPNQRPIIDNIIAGDDSLVIMPTGGGKSLCYQLPALMLDGLTVVVSPLIALMQDQVTQLRALGVKAAFINSTMAFFEQNMVKQQALTGKIKLLYVAPETLLKPDMLELLDGCNVKLLAIDEAHCISAWGHDFRPEYRRIVEVRERYPEATCIALTATATPRVQEDIRQTLAFKSDDVFLASFDRPNLFISAEEKSNTLNQVLAFLEPRRGQSGIIYAGTRRRVDALVERLKERGYKVAGYHAGLDAAQRQANQIAFVRDDVDIIVATIAFGMGIDKPDVRFVLHTNLPKNIENYYQQIGRAGRDGLRADVYLIFGYDDIARQRQHIGQGAQGEQRGREMRLQKLVTWAENRRTCRRHGLLQYFGEVPTRDSCDFCDNCTTERADDSDLTVLAQKFLACVYRTKQMFGASHIIDVLRGSKSQRVIERGHDQLSTYNIGADLTKKQWQKLARQFVSATLLQANEHGGLALTPAGIAVMKGQEPFMGLMPVAREKQRRDEAAAVQLEYNTDLFEILRGKRKELADNDNVPPYVIFSDRALMEMATYFPHSAESFNQMHGIGTRKVAQFADTILPIIRAYCAQNGLVEKPKATQRANRQPRQSTSMTQKKARWEEVGERFLAGETMASMMIDYGVKKGTIIANLNKFVSAGNDVPMTYLQEASDLSFEDQEAVFAAFMELGEDRLRPIYDHFNERISYDELRIMGMLWAMQDTQPAPTSTPPAQPTLAYDPPPPVQTSPSGWSGDEDQQLLFHLANGKSIKQVAELLDRNPFKVAERFHQLQSS